MPMETTDRASNPRPEQRSAKVRFVGRRLMNRLLASEHRLWLLALLLLVALVSRYGRGFLAADRRSIGRTEGAAGRFGDARLPCSGSTLGQRSKEMAELHGLVRGLEQRASTTPDGGQLEKSCGLVERSQRRLSAT